MGGKSNRISKLITSYTTLLPVLILSGCAATPIPSEQATFLLKGQIVDNRYLNYR